MTATEAAVAEAAEVREADNASFSSYLPGRRQDVRVRGANCKDFVAGGPATALTPFAFSLVSPSPYGKLCGIGRPWWGPVRRQIDDSTSRHVLWQPHTYGNDHLRSRVRFRLVLEINE